MDRSFDDVIVALRRQLAAKIVRSLGEGGQHTIAPTFGIRRIGKRGRDARRRGAGVDAHPNGANASAAAVARDDARAVPVRVFQWEAQSIFGMTGLASKSTVQRYFALSPDLVFVERMPFSDGL